MIIANHMLNLANKNRIFSEIDRLLTDDGFAYASSPSMKNLQELMGLVVGFNDSLEFDNEMIRSFNLENGESVLSEYFNVENSYLYQNDVIVNNTEAIILYLASCFSPEQLDILIESIDDFRSYLKSVIKKKKELRITNKTVLFKFRKK